MNRTKIDWVVNPDGSQGFSWNPLVGCTKGCPYCYARRIATTRLARLCDDCATFTPHLHEERLEQPIRRKKPSTIFLGSMGDLFDPHVPYAWRRQIWDIVEQTPRHHYLFLTKQPQNITQGESALINELPQIWPGVSVPRGKISEVAFDQFISFEPLLGPIDFNDAENPPIWIIIGALTGPGGHQPKAEWIGQVVDWAWHGGGWRRPIFAKDNLDWPKELGERPRELPYLTGDLPSATDD